MRLPAATTGNLRALVGRDLTIDKEGARAWINNKSFKTWIIQTYGETIQWQCRGWTPRAAKTITTLPWDKQDTPHRTKWDSRRPMEWTASSSKIWMGNCYFQTKPTLLLERKDRITNLISTRFTWTTCQTKGQEAQSLSSRCLISKWQMETCE